MPEPYKSTPIFDEVTLPQAIRTEHRTKAGTWGLLRVLAGRATLVFTEPRREVLVLPGAPAEIAPEATHFVELSGSVQLQVDFYREPPLGPGK